MNAHPFPRTSAAITILQDEISFFLRIIGIVIQTITIGFYGVMVYLNYQSVPRVVAYTVLTVVSLTLFILGFVLSPREGDMEEQAKKRRRQKQKVTLIFKTLNYVARLGLIVLALIDIVAGTATQVGIVATTVSGILFISGLLLEIIAQLVIHYTDFLGFALSRDVEEHRILSGIGETRQNPYHIVEKVTDVLAGNKQNPKDDLTPRQKRLDDKLMGQYQENKSKKAVKEDRQREINAAKRQRSKLRIKENLKRIFGKDKGKKD